MLKKLDKYILVWYTVTTIIKEKNMKQILATEKEICKMIVKKNKCPCMFTVKGTHFCGCDYCPFGNKKHKGLKCVNYATWNNQKEVVRQAKKFLEKEKKMPKKTNILIRVSEEEKKAIKENAEKRNMTVSEHLRTLGAYAQILDYDTSNYGNTVKINEVK